MSTPPCLTITEASPQALEALIGEARHMKQIAHVQIEKRVAPETVGLIGRLLALLPNVYQVGLVATGLPSGLVRSVLLHAPGLTHLAVSRERVNEAAAGDFLVGCKAGPAAMTHLGVYNTEFEAAATSQACSLFGHGLDCLQLEFIEIRYCRLDIDQFAAIWEPAGTQLRLMEDRFHELAHLDLFANCIRQVDLPRLARLLRGTVPKLRQLLLDENRLKNAGFSNLAYDEDAVVEYKTAEACRQFVRTGEPARRQPYY